MVVPLSRSVGILPTIAHEMCKKSPPSDYPLLCAWAMAAGRHLSLKNRHDAPCGGY